MSGRARQILGRLPAHLEPARPGKLLGLVTEALAADLDVQAADLAAVRRAHRLGHADTRGDLLRIGALLDVSAEEFTVLEARMDALGERPSFRVMLDLVRVRLATLARLHAAGNGSVEALLRAAANALDLDVTGLLHGGDRFWHAARVSDRLPGAEAPPDEAIVMEENPLRRVTHERGGVIHAELFSVLRKGFERQHLEIRITGIADRTQGPMVVARDTGRGVGFAGVVPDGETLVLTDQGRALLGEVDVTPQAYGWEGGVFAVSDSDRHPFCFGDAEVELDRAARFAVSTPLGALNTDATFPGAGETLPLLDVATGETRLAFFVQEGHWSSRDADGSVRRVPPRTAIAFADRSVFAPPPVPRQTAAELELAWNEHEAHAVQVWIPERLAALDDSDGPAVADRVRKALERHRAAGVQVRVGYVDDRWVLGTGELSDADSADPIARIRSATRLWS